MLQSVSRQLRRLVHGSRPPVSPELPRSGALAHYVTAAPSPANIAALFRDNWVSKLPPEMGLAGGGVSLFDDARIQNYLKLVNVTGKSVLELGPLEAGHTTQLIRAGAASVTAVEGNSLAFLKCLAVKEALGLTNARFLLGDFVEFLRERRHAFEVGVACGVLYHMRNPVELIELLAHSCRDVYVWTHYYDPCIRDNAAVASHLKNIETASWKGFRHTAVRYDYEQAVDTDKFCGGTAPNSFWLPRPDLLAAFEYFGFTKLQILNDDPNHPHGPSIGFAASR